MIGTTLAHYEITAHLGSGGMGDVYQATDLKLGRSVAVKFLPEAFARDSERLARFEREARVLASLNHPNIAAIHGMEDADGKTFLVMELVDGETLADRINRGPVPLDEAIGIARQITESLEAAHASGVVHRDLKPANIKVRADGTVKVLDFGLAKALDRLEGDGFSRRPADVEASARQTITSPAMTQVGIVLGTASYMSPEQARGKAVDKRTDIFAFGCVLFEMLTGRRAFDGEDVADTLSRVIQRDPAWDLLPPSVPLRVVDVLRLCLEKNLRMRRSDIADVRIDLDLALNAAPAGAATAPATVRRSPAAWIAAGIAFVIAGVLAVPAWRYMTHRVEQALPVRFVEVAPNGNDLQPVVSVSPDGTMVVFASGSAGSGTMWLRRMNARVAVELVAARAASSFDVFWSPDSRHLAFRDAGQLRVTDVATGATRVICDLAITGVFGGAWSSEGTILLGSATGVVRVTATGGIASPLALTDGADPKAARAVSQFLPDGHHFLYAVPKTESPGGGLTVYAGDLRTGDARALLDANSWAQAASGYLLFVRAGTLYAQTFDADSIELSGEATAIEPVIPSLPTFSVSQNGILGLRPPEGRPPSDLVWIDRNGAVRGTLKKPPTGDYGNPAVSPDGTRVAVNSLDSRNGRSDIWIVDTARDVAERFTLGEGPSADPLWSPDGRQIAFVSERNGRLHIVTKATDGSGEQVLEDFGPGTLNFSGGLRVVLSDWSSDGRFIAYSFGTAAGRSIRVLSVADRKSSVLPLQAVSPYSMRFSRDGKWIAYAALDSGQMEVFIRAFPALNQQHQVSNGGGRHPRWGKNDREIFYNNRVVNVVSLAESGTDLLPGVSRVVFDRDMREPLDNRHHYTVTPDGQRLLVRQPSGSGALSSVHVLVNWPAMLQQ